MNYLINKSKKISAYGLILYLIMFSYSCKDLTSLNDNPNEPSTSPTTYLLTGAQHNLADNYWTGGRGLGRTYSQYWTGNQYTETSRFSYRSGDVNDLWDDYYLPLNSLQQIIRQNYNNSSAYAQYGNTANQIAVAKILKAWTFQTMTDIWGDIPFEKALKGSANPTPVYTSQDSVYTGIISMLTEASDSMQVSEPAFTGGDAIYGGDAAQWKKLANSLKMRAAIRIADAKPELAKTAFNEAKTAGAIVTNANNALFHYKSAPPNNNPINEGFKTGIGSAMSNTLIDFMNSNHDPRRGAYAEPAINTNATKYAGFPYGLAQGEATNYKNKQPWSRPSKRISRATAPAIIMTASEVLFNEAEAAQRGWTSDNPAAKYNAAIQASMNYWDVSSSKAQTYVTNHLYNEAKWRKNIGRQKWVALYLQGAEGWSVWRRLNFGLLKAPASGKLGVSFDAPIALRYPYPPQEHNLNSEHVNAALSNQNFSADNQGQKLWWDKAAENAN